MPGAVLPLSRKDRLETKASHYHVPDPASIKVSKKNKVMIRF